MYRRGGVTNHAPAGAVVMDRTTLGRNIRPLQRDSLVAIGPGKDDRRRKELRLTPSGVALFEAAQKGWAKAQAGFERTFGVRRAKALRILLENVASRELTPATD